MLSRRALKENVTLSVTNYLRSLSSMPMSADIMEIAGIASCHLEKRHFDKLINVLEHITGLI